MNQQPLETEKYLVDRSNDPYLKRMNRRPLKMQQIRRWIIRSLIGAVVVVAAGSYCLDSNSGPGHNDARLINLGRVLKAMVGELNQEKKIMDELKRMT